MAEAIDLTRRGSAVDVDTVEHDLPKWLRFYWEHGGDPARLTASADASISSPRTLLEQVRACVLEHRFPLERVLPHVTANTAAVLRLPAKGNIAEGADADVLVLDADSLDLLEVVAGGRRLVKDRRPAVRERCLEHSDRDVRLTGDRAAREMRQAPAV